MYVLNTLLNIYMQWICNTMKDSDHAKIVYYSVYYPITYYLKDFIKFNRTR